jgi:hypothetical protein
MNKNLLQNLTQVSANQDPPLSETANRVLRLGFTHVRDTHPPAYREHTFALGEPTIDLDKAFDFAALLEDHEVIRKQAFCK